MVRFIKVQGDRLRLMDDANRFHRNSSVVAGATIYTISVDVVVLASSSFLAGCSVVSSEANPSQIKGMCWGRRLVLPLHTMRR